MLSTLECVDWRALSGTTIAPLRQVNVLAGPLDTEKEDALAAVCGIVLLGQPDGKGRRRWRDRRTGPERLEAAAELSAWTEPSGSSRGAEETRISTSGEARATMQAAYEAASEDTRSWLDEAMTATGSRAGTTGTDDHTRGEWADGLGHGALEGAKALLACRRAAGNVVCADRADAMLHTDGVNALWNCVAETIAANGTQVFWTTGRLATQQAAIRACERHGVEIAFHVLEPGREGRAVHTATYTGETLAGAVDLGLALD